MSENGGKRSKRRRRFGRVFARQWASGRRTWSAQWFDTTQDRRVTRHFDSQKEAKDFLDELEQRIVAKVYETPPTQADARNNGTSGSTVKERCNATLHAPTKAPPSTRSARDKTKLAVAGPGSPLHTSASRRLARP